MIRTRYMALGLLGTAAILCSCGKKPESHEELSKPVKTITIKGTKSSGRVLYPATVAANKQADLSFEVGGLVIEIKVNPGQKVKKGQLLARIDPRDYQNKLKVQKAVLDEAKSDYERYKKLVKSGAVAVADFEKRKRNYEMAKSNYQIAEKAYNDTFLKAPFHGVIALKFIEEKQTVAAKQKVFSLQDDTEIDVSINIPEQDMARAKRYGDRQKTEKALDPLAIFPAAPDKKFPLTIKEFQDSADPVTQTFKITFKMPSPEGLVVRAGMTANVSLKKSYFLGEKSAGFKIPFTAVFVGTDGKKHVWKVGEDGRAHSAPVGIGSLGGADALVTSGIKDGDIIVVAGVNALREGMKVHVDQGNQ